MVPQNPFFERAFSLESGRKWYPNQGFEEQRLRSPEDVSSEAGVQLIESVDSDSAVKRKSILAPWVRGRENSRKFHESEGNRKFQEKVNKKDQCQNEESLISFIQDSEDLVKEVTFDGNFEDNCGEFDALPIIYSEKNEILGNVDSEAATFKKDSSPISQEMGSINMTRTHEVLERRTGGLIIWRSGSLVVLYRGMAYKLDCVKSYGKHIESHIRASGSSEDLVKESSQSISVKHVGRAEESAQVDTSNYSKNISNEEEMALHELNHLLDELGTRFIDWSGREPLPADADLLPAVVPGYKPTFRLLPHGTRQALKDKEMTYLRTTARTLPPHFALGV